MADSLSGRPGEDYERYGPNRRQEQAFHDNFRKQSQPPS